MESYHLDLIRAMEYLCFRLHQEIASSAQAKITLDHHPKYSRLIIKYLSSDGETQNIVSVNILTTHPFSYPLWLDYVADNLQREIEDDVSCDLHFEHVESVCWFDEVGALVNEEDRASKDPVHQKDEVVDEVGYFKTMQDLADAHDEFLYTPQEGFNEHDWDLEQISPLKLLGYTVGNNGLPRNRRLAFLIKFFTVHLPATVSQPYKDSWGEPLTAKRLEKMLRHINANIFRARNNAAQSRAVEDWNEDVIFLRSLLLQDTEDNSIKASNRSDMDDEIPF